MTEMFGEAWSPMSVPDLAPDDDDDDDDDTRIYAHHELSFERVTSAFSLS